MSFRTLLYVAAIGIVAILGAWFSWDFFSTYQQDQANERNNSTSYYSETSEGRVNTCNAIMSESGFAAWLVCFAENPPPNNEVNQAEHDLKAQQDMATWALGMLIATLWLTFITLVGVYFVWKTLRATRDIGNQQLRAYVEVGDARIDGETFSFCVIIPVQNFGQTPAKKFRFKRHIGYGDEPLPDFSEIPWVPENGMPLAPGHAYNIVADGIDLSAAVKHRHEDGSIFKVAGIAEYIDIGGEIRETRFRLRVDTRDTLTEAPTITPEREGNYST